MFTEITKSFAQSFLVGHLLPAILFVAFAKFVVGYPQSQGLVAFFAEISKADNLADLGIFGLILGLLLSTLNREVIRFYEGYGGLNPFRLLFLVPCVCINERHRFRRLNTKIDELSVAARLPTAAATVGQQLGDLQFQLARDFPEDEALVQATRFGNTIRAFERYSGVAYGFEAIEGTNRLESSVDEAVRSEISWAKSKVDFWINIGVLALVSTILWLVFVTGQVSCAGLLPMAIGLAASYLAIILARHAALEWGVNVKAGIDLALPKLAEALDYELPADAERQQAFWTLLSQHFLLRDPTTLHDLQQFRRKPPPKPRPTKTAKARKFLRKRAKP